MCNHGGNQRIVLRFGIVLASILLIATLSCKPNATAERSSTACGMNLAIIEQAKYQCRTARMLSNGCHVTVADIAPFITGGKASEFLRCPGCGTYEIGSIGEAPRCSVHGCLLTGTKRSIEMVMPEKVVAKVSAMALGITGSGYIVQLTNASAKLPIIHLGLSSNDTSVGRQCGVELRNAARLLACMQIDERQEWPIVDITQGRDGELSLHLSGERTIKIHAKSDGTSVEWSKESIRRWMRKVGGVLRDTRQGAHPPSVFDCDSPE